MMRCVFNQFKHIWSTISKVSTIYDNSLSKPFHAIHVDVWEFQKTILELFCPNMMHLYSHYAHFHYMFHSNWFVYCKLWIAKHVWNVLVRVSCWPKTILELSIFVHFYSIICGYHIRWPEHEFLWYFVKLTKKRVLFNIIPTYHNGWLFLIFLILLLIYVLLFWFLSIRKK